MGEVRGCPQAIADIWSARPLHCSVDLVPTHTAWCCACCHHGLLEAIIVLQHGNDFNLEKGYLTQGPKQPTANTTLRTFLCLLNEKISILMTSLIVSWF